MAILEKVRDRAHRLLCGTTFPLPSDGCCGCDADQADVYVVTCDYCRRSFEGFCWSCVDAWPGTTWEPLGAYQVFAGHERPRP